MDNKCSHHYVVVSLLSFSKTCLVMSYEKCTVTSSSTSLPTVLLLYNIHRCCLLVVLVLVLEGNTGTSTGNNTVLTVLVLPSTDLVTVVVVMAQWVLPVQKLKYCLRCDSLVIMQFTRHL
jgi:hypothetical protein